jgi:signal peptidase I
MHKPVCVLVILAVLVGCSTQRNNSLAPSLDFSKYKSQFVEVRGNSMSPLLKDGTSLRALVDYYTTNEPKRYDVVMYNFSAGSVPLVKVILGVPGDSWELRKNRATYYIMVNDKILNNSVGVPYAFSNDEAAMLKLNANTYPVIPEQQYLIFGDNIESSKDSSLFGMVHRKDILGRLVIN